MNYKVGEKVRVRKDLVDFHNYSGITMRHGMQEFAGKEYVVEEVVEGINRTAAELSCGYFWSFEMLEPVYEIGDKVRIIKIQDGYPMHPWSYRVMKPGVIGIITQKQTPSIYGDFDVVSIKVDEMRDSIPVSCIEKVSDVAEETKRCSSCKHENLSISKQPCRACMARSDAYAKWSPKDTTTYPTKINAIWGVQGMFNVVFVTHDSDQTPCRKYIFAVPHDVTIKKGDKVFADTRKGKKIVTAYTNSFKTDKAGLDAMDIMNGCHKGELKSITGYAQKQEEWKEVPFR